MRPSCSLYLISTDVFPYVYVTVLSCLAAPLSRGSSLNSLSIRGNEGIVQEGLLGARLDPPAAIWWDDMS